MIATLLYISGLAFAAFMGAIVGAGLIQATQRERDKIRAAELLNERESIGSLIDMLLKTHGDVHSLIQQTVELSACNAEVLKFLRQASHAAGLAALAAAATGRPN